KNLDGPLDFLGAANHGIELALAGEFGEVTTEAVERRGPAPASAAPFTLRLVFAPFATRGSTATSLPFAPLDAMSGQVQHLLADILELEAKVHEHLGGDPFLLAQQAQQDMLGADVIVVEVTSLFHRVLNHLLGARRLRKPPHG